MNTLINLHTYHGKELLQDGYCHACYKKWKWYYYEIVPVGEIYLIPHLVRACSYTHAVILTKGGAYFSGPYFSIKEASERGFNLANQKRIEQRMILEIAYGVEEQWKYCKL